MKTLRGNKTLAILLSVAMILSSENFAMYAHATENGTTDGVEITEDVEMTEPVFAADGSNHGEDNGGDNGQNNGGDNGGDNGQNNGGEKGTQEGEDYENEEIIVENPNDDFGVGKKSGILRPKPGTELSALKGTVTIPAGAKKIPAGIFSRNLDIVGVVIPENSQLTEIEAGAFDGSGIKEISIPDAVTQIPDRAFKNSNLLIVKFGTGSQLASIGEEAFMGCKITGLTIPGLVTSVGAYAFSGCSELTNVQLANVETIGDSAFKNCIRLDVIGWSKNLKAVGNSAFSACAIKDIKADAEFGAGIVSIGASVFENCSLLTTVVLHSNLKQISVGMFKDCVKLSSITLPTDCTLIESEAFYGCAALKKITIPRNVSRIKARAFADCVNLAEVTIQQIGPGGVSDIVLDRDSFPQKALTMKGYDGTVEDYAQEKGYTYKSLLTDYKITLSVGDHGSASLSKKTGKEGDIIEVTVTPADGYRLKASKFKYNDTNITKLKEEKGGKMVFTFVMPADDVKVTVSFEAKSAAMGSFSAEFEQVGQMTYDWDRKAKKLTFANSGLACRLVIVSSKLDCDPGPWMFNYTSSKPKIVAVDSEGVIYARGEGEAKVTATLKSSLVENSDAVQTISFNVIVKAEADIDNYSLSFSNLKKAKEFTENIDGETFSIIQYTKTNLLKSNMEFDAHLVATAGSDPTNLFTRSTWTVFNPEMATLEKETVENNTNHITVLKETVGETAVTVTVTNGKTGKDKVVLYEKSFIIRVIDVTPRLLQEAVIVNRRCSSGTVYDLLSVYGYEVNPNSLRVVQSVKKKGSNGKYTTNYEPTAASSYVSCRYSGGKYYLDMTEDGKRFMLGKSSKTYTNMFLEGEYSYLADNGTMETDTFRTPIKSLVLVDRDVKPSVKFNGKINLFYNSRATAEEQGRTQAIQSLKDLVVEEYALVSEANYIKAGSEEIDSLANNFVIDKDGVITRSGNPLIKDGKGKPVVKGYLRIKYEGYEAYHVKITIPTQNKKPAYMLSKNKVTVNTHGSGYRVALQVLEKKTKKPVSLKSLADLSFDESSKGTTMGLFENLDAAEARATDNITLQIKRAQTGKAVINVELDTWNEPMKFTMNLKTTGALPAVKAKPATLILNNQCVGKAAETVLTLNQAAVVLDNMDKVEYAGNGKLAGDAPKIIFRYDGDKGRLSAVANEELTPGIYKFRITPGLEYCNGQTELAKPVVINVKVIASNLSMVLKPASVTLNNRYVGVEEGIINYTIKNMPAGSDVKIISDDVVIEGTNGVSEGYRNAFDISFAADKPTISVSQNSMVRQATSYKYTVSGLKVEVEGKAVAIQPFKITIKSINKEAKLTATAKGTLNIGNSDSRIVYTLKLKNINAKMNKVVAMELDTTDGSDKSYAKLVNFDMEEIRVKEESVQGTMDGTTDGTTDGIREGTTDGVITAIAIKSNQRVLNAKKKYKIRLGVVLPGAAGEEGEIIWTKDLAIKPKQLLPKVKADVTEATLYAGVPIDSPKRSQEFRITKTTQTSAEIVGAGLTSGNPDHIKKAFKVTFDPITQKAKLTLIRPDLVLVDTEYVVTMEARVLGQMVNTKGATFSVKVKVLN